MLQKIICLILFNRGKSKKERFDNKKAEQNEDFHVIPLYSAKEMKSARKTNDENEIWDYLYRQAINGYIGIYKKWLIGKGIGGRLVKIDLESDPFDINDLADRVMKTQSKARYGYELNNQVYCKLSYDLKDQDLFSRHVNLKKEYIEGEIYEDFGTYNGLHFSDLDHFEMCLEHSRTFYGNKIVILEPVDEGVYYQYMNNVYIGRKIKILRVNYMDDIDTWRQLESLQRNIIEDKKSYILNYLEDLREIDIDREYENVIEYVRSFF
ncbi:MAG: hypothetical protein HDR05_05160 [Lachnospiraceae bacterium]|nr:hypothetical protein [Lachnospiraceae bacterium]